MAWTDVVQVALLIVGGLVTTVIALQHVSPNGEILTGLQTLFDKVPEKFSMILEKGEIITPNGKDAWWDLPGLAVLIGGMWVANLYYWGFNQYIIQRTLAAKNIKEAQKGIALAAFLKLIIPIIVVLPGIIAYVMNIGPDGLVTAQSVDPSFIGKGGKIINDNAAPWLIKTFIPTGLKGLVLAALAAAIVSSLASILNSTATIFTMDIYKPYINKNASEGRLVNVGRSTAAVGLVIAVLIAPQLKNLGQVFQYIQEYTGVVSPGILAVFMLGLFWKKTTNKAAIIGVVLSIPIALYFKVAPNGWFESILFLNLPFLDQMLWTWILSMIIMVIVSYLETKGKDNEKGIELSKELFRTGKGFNISALVIIVILIILYTIFW